MQSKFTSKRLYSIAIGALLILCGCTSIPEGISPVSGFDSQRYLGTWYEIARFDHSFERGLNNVTATYTNRDDGGIDVLNRGYNQQQGEWEEAKGKAYFVESADKGHLKVSFFGPFYASYVIMQLDHQGYQYSLVTGPTREYLWVLARRPNVSNEILEELLGFAQQNGFDTSEFIWVEHNVR